MLALLLHCMGCAHSAIPVGSGIFPESAEVLSPGKRHSLVTIADPWYEPDPATTKYYFLYLRDARTGEMAMVCMYSGTVSAVWSPDGAKVAITDRHASDAANCFLVFVDGSESMDVEELLRSHPDARQAFPFLDQDHVYIKCDRWVSDDVLAIIVDVQSFEEEWYRIPMRYNTVTEELMVGPKQPTPVE